MSSAAHKLAAGWLAHGPRAGGPCATAAAVAVLACLAGPLPAGAAPRAQMPCAESGLQSPKPGDVLQGAVPIYGSARIADFNFYKLEYAAQNAPDSWAAVSTTKPAPVISGLLDVWNTGAVRDGQYLLKLTVVDSVGQEVCRYTVPNLAVGNLGTPTPTDTATPEQSPTPTEAVPLEPSATVTPLPTVAPILPANGENGGGSLDVFGAVGDAGLVDAFLKGFIGALALAFAALVVIWLRS